MTEATLRLGIDASRAKAGARDFNGAVGTISHDARNAALAVAAVGTAIAAMSLKFVSVASVAEETQSKFNTVFRNLASEANAWAEGFGDSVGRARMEVKAWMAGLQDTFVPLGLARDKGLELSKSLVTLAVDVGTFQHAADADVIRDFTSALVGNHESVRKYAIMINDGALEQEAFDQGLKKSYSDLTNLEKVMLRYSLLQKGSTDAMGAAIRMGDSYAGQQKRLRAEWTNTQEMLGNTLLPAYTRALTGINKFLLENQDAIKTWAENTVEGISMVVNAWKDFQLFANKPGINPQYAPGEEWRGVGTSWGGGIQGLGAPSNPSGYHPSPTGGQNMAASTQERRLNGEFMEFYDYQEAARKASAGSGAIDFMSTAPSIPALAGEGAATPTRFVETAEMQAEAKARAEAETKIKDMFIALGNEQEIIGMVNESRQRGWDLIELENQARIAGRKDVEELTAAYMKELEALRSAERLRAIADGIGESFGRAFEDTAFGAAKAGEAIRALAMDIAHLVMQQMITQPLANVISSWAYGAFSPSKSASTPVDYSGVARGAVFNRGHIVPFGSGGVVDDLTYFPLAGGQAGVMGEAGPEAVMPLRRGAGGRLGVELTSAQAQTPPNVVINNNSGIALDQQGAPQFDGEQWVVNVVAKNISNRGTLHGVIKEQQRAR
jgi:hypothetical protein